MWGLSLSQRDGADQEGSVDAWWLLMHVKARSGADGGWVRLLWLLLLLLPLWHDNISDAFLALHCMCFRRPYGSVLGHVQSHQPR